MQNIRGYKFFMPLFMPLHSFTMSYTYTFNLKNPKSATPTLIYLRANIKSEGKYLKYSTGESILPSQWDTESKFPIKIGGRTAQAVQINSTINQLSRYAETFQVVCSRIEMRNDILTVKRIREELDYEFKKTATYSKSFFPLFEAFIQEKRDLNKIAQSTIKTYENMKRVLEEFSKAKNYKINFNTINNDFYVAFVNYSRSTLKHQNNTLGRNIGFIITFMNWAAKYNHHRNYEFKQFEKPKSETDEIALTKKELDHLYTFEFKKKSLERVRDVFIFGCTTGMRYSDYSKITKNHIHNGHIFLNSKKQKNNLGIPLNSYSRYILEKYDYSLPIISDQKFREYIKEACQKAGFTANTVKTSYIGNKRTDEIIPKHKRISTHTARRTFITLSLENGMRQDIVMSITGHKSLSSFQKYIKLSSKSREEAMKNVWK
ncbi:integrase [Dokdonia sinensis]|uniref:Integrase n=1 Tax=Dokdonia sinensis TaxID=2479847 RepID=A0A3M0G4F3_9FLAO|nr:site-specific integrase [Dokdonia sinensis]RMB56049.1 integrase [Dokdonia sinensis]